MKLNTRIELDKKKAYINALENIEELRVETKEICLQLFKKKSSLVKKEFSSEFSSEFSLETTFRIATINKDIDSLTDINDLKEICINIYEQILLIDELQNTYFQNKI
jgi:hypothetical protein